MARFEIVMPKLGESIIEATITKWLKNVGDTVAEDESIVEIATDKVDSEIPSPVEGILSERLFNEGDVIPVGKIIAIIDMGGESAEPQKKVQEPQKETAIPKPEKIPEKAQEPTRPARFLSPLIRNMAAQENIPIQELESLPGSGKDNRLTKTDFLAYLKTRISSPTPTPILTPTPSSLLSPPSSSPSQPLSGTDQALEMDRIRQLIASHMVRSVQTSPHVTSFVEADVTGIVKWRERTKEGFQKRENIKLTYTPVFIEAIAKAIRENPMVNVSVDGTRIILHKRINIGMAVALPNYNLIVPVIHNADQSNLLGLIRRVTDLAERARLGKLVPDEISGGTLSLTNLGSFGTLAGTPIINQPQAAIVAVGSIKKRPVVVEGPFGDSIAIRHMMFVSLTYDHRVIDGALAGQFLNRLVWHLENFDSNLED